MARTQDSAQILSRLEVKGIATVSAGSDDGYKFVRTNSSGLVDDTMTPAVVTTHMANDARHLTSSQNTLLDAITVTAAEINYLTGASSNIQSQINTHIADSTKHLTTSQNTLLDGITVGYEVINFLDSAAGNIQSQINTGSANLSTHIADATKHLTSSQNTLLDNLTATYTELNYVSGVTSAIQTQLDAKTTALSSHASDASLHLTSSQNTWLDAITASSTEINYLVGVTSAVQTQLSAKLPSSYLDTDTALTANSDTRVASQKATKAYVDGVAFTLDTGWGINTGTSDKTVIIPDYTAAGTFTSGLETHVIKLTKKLIAIEALLASKKYPDH